MGAPIVGQSGVRAVADAALSRPSGILEEHPTRASAERRRFQFYNLRASDRREAWRTTGQRISPYDDLICTILERDGRWFLRIEPSYQQIKDAKFIDPLTGEEINIEPT